VEIRCRWKSGVEIRCQFIILARKDELTSVEIRCQFIILARKDELTSRQESSGKEDSRKLETFQMEPCG